MRVYMPVWVGACVRLCARVRSRRSHAHRARHVRVSPPPPCAACVQRNPGATSCTAGFSTLALSRFTSVVLLVVYLAYLTYQLKTHSFLYEDEQDPAEKTGIVEVEVPVVPMPQPGGQLPRLHSRALSESADQDEEEGEDDDPLLGFWGSISALFAPHNPPPYRLSLPAPFVRVSQFG